MKKILIISTLMLSASGFLINNQIEFIPSWLSIDGTINNVSFLFLILSVLSGFYLIYLLIKQRPKNSTKLFSWFKIIIFSLGIITYLWLSIGFTIIYSKHSVFEIIFSGREYVMELNYPEFKKTFYIYEHPCFLGATIKEPCNDFDSILYIKNKWTPTMSVIAEFSFPAGNVIKRNNFVEIHPDGKGWDFNLNYLLLNLETNTFEIVEKESKGTSANNE